MSSDIPKFGQTTAISASERYGLLWNPMHGSNFERISRGLLQPYSNNFRLKQLR